MTIWFVFTAIFLTLVVALLPAVARGDALQRIVVLELASVVWTIALVCFAEASDRDVYFAVPLVLAVTSAIGSLVYVRIFERWL